MGTFDMRMIFAIVGLCWFISKAWILLRWLFSDEDLQDIRAARAKRRLMK